MKIVFILWLFFVLNAVQCAQKPCQLRQYANGYVCVCNETYCDTMEVEKPQRFGDFRLISSTKAGKRFEVSKGKFKPKPLEPNVIRVKRNADGTDIEGNENQDDKSWLSSITLTVNQDKQYQSIVGFGGAFTGTVSHLLDLMPESLRHALYRNYFSTDEGIGYTMMRIPIGGNPFILSMSNSFPFVSSMSNANCHTIGCDFDLQPWAYNEQPIDDKDLSNFTKLDAHDVRRNEQIQELKKVAEIDNIKLLGTAWSAPRWERLFSLVVVVVLFHSLIVFLQPIRSIDFRLLPFESGGWRQITHGRGGVHWNRNTIKHGPTITRAFYLWWPQKICRCGALRLATNRWMGKFGCFSFISWA